MLYCDSDYQLFHFVFIVIITYQTTNAILEMLSLIPQLNLKVDFIFWITPSLDAIVLQIAEHAPEACGNYLSSGT